MEIDSEDTNDLLLCPVRALNIYLERRPAFTRADNDDMLWPVRESSLAKYFKELVNEALVFYGVNNTHLRVSTHQCRKFAVSLSKNY